jgi:hypothetical protein
VRASGNHEREIYETRSHYRAMAFSYIIHRSQTIVWKGSDHPRLLQEEYFFRNAETFQREAPTFFPVVGSSPQEPTLLTHEAAGKEDVSVQDPTGQKDR